MTNETVFYGTREAGEQLGMQLPALQMWLTRHPEYRPTRRISGDDLLWTPADIERVRLARAAKAAKRTKTK